MTDRKRIPDGPANGPWQARAEAAFAALDAYRALSAPAEAEAGVIGRPTFQRLYLYATGAIDDSEIVHAAREDRRTATTLAALVARFAPFRMPRQAAAASGSYNERQGIGWRMRFQRSRADAGQIYVVIELDDQRAAPKRLFAVTADDRCETCALPAAREGVIQLLEEEGSALLAALQERSTEVSLL